MSGTVERWDVITVGNLSRNRFWGESEERPMRPTLCTCTLICGADFRLLVDPSCEDRDRMAAELDRRTGLKLADITAVFVTHEHGDHHFGLRHFEDAAWLAAPDVARAINESGSYARRVDGAGARIFDGVDIIATPGHTLSHASLRFDCDGFSVVVAGDAVMAQHFWRARQGFFNSADSDRAARTIDDLATLADIIVPGHDNYFIVSPPAGR